MIKHKDLKKGMTVYWNEGGYVGRRYIVEGKVVIKDGKMWIKHKQAYHDPAHMELYTKEEKDKYTTGYGNVQIVVPKETEKKNREEEKEDHFTFGFVLVVVFFVLLFILFKFIYLK